MGGTPVPHYRTRQSHYIMHILQRSLRARKVGWMADLKTLKGVGEKDRKLIEDAEAIVGPEPSKMGFVKNLFWGNFREDLVFPYPATPADEQARCDELLARLDQYLRTAHPSVEFAPNQDIPRSATARLFKR